MIIEWVKTSIYSIKKIIDLECFNLLLTLLTICLSVLTQSNQTLNIYITENNEITLLIDTDKYFFDLTFRSNKQLELFIGMLKYFNFMIKKISIEESIYNYINRKYRNELPTIVIKNIVKQYLLEVE